MDRPAPPPASPGFGVGFGQFLEHHDLTAHNSFILAAAELGLPGLLIWSLDRLPRGQDPIAALRAQVAPVAKTWALALLASMAGLLVGSIFLSFAYKNVFWIFIGLTGVLYQAIQRHDPDFRVRFGVRDLGILADRRRSAPRSRSSAIRARSSAGEHGPETSRRARREPEDRAAPRGRAAQPAVGGARRRDRRRPGAGARPRRSGSGTRGLPSLEALREAGADVIHVLTPPETHAEVALAALELGCHVLVEKPLATSVEDCRRVQAVAERRGLVASVNHSLLFDPQVVRALETVRAGKLGEVVSVDILRGSAYPPFGGGPLPPQYRSAGYPFRDLGVHALYLLPGVPRSDRGRQREPGSRGAATRTSPSTSGARWSAASAASGSSSSRGTSSRCRARSSCRAREASCASDLFLMFQAMRKSMPRAQAHRARGQRADRLDAAARRRALGRPQVRDREPSSPTRGSATSSRPSTRRSTASAPCPSRSLTRRPSCAGSRRSPARPTRTTPRVVARLPRADTADVLVTGASGGLGGRDPAEARSRDGGCGSSCDGRLRSCRPAWTSCSATSATRRRSTAPSAASERWCTSVRR